jgi:hypothetical protein
MIDKNALYVMSTSWHVGEPADFNGLAIDLQEWPNDNTPGKRMLAFHDTVRGHMISGKVTEEPDGTVIIQRNENETFTFKPCTLDMFRRTYYKIAYNGENIATVCTSTDDLWEYYRRRLKEDFM